MNYEVVMLVRFFQDENKNESLICQALVFVTSYLQPHNSYLRPHTYDLIPTTSYLKPHPEKLNQLRHRSLNPLASLH
jgi:hypothetical protein